jgi:hypothetical protein
MNSRRLAITQRAFVILLVAISFAIGLAASVGALAISLYVDMAHSRVDRIEETCVRVNEVARAQRDFVRDVAPSLLDEARRRFEVVPDCRAYAKERVKLPLGTR